MISKSFSTSAKRAVLQALCPKMSEFCEFLFVLLVAHADDHGRLPGDEFTVQMQINPVSKRKLPDFVAALHLLHEAGLILWYQVDGKKLIEIVKFSEHQDLKGHNLRPGKLPPCPSDEAYIGRRGNLPPNSPNPPLSKSKLSESNLSEANGSSEASSEPLVPSLTVLTFPTVGADGTSWQLSEAQAAEWATLFPHLDVLAEARKALAWLMANQGRRKTARGMTKFLVGWLSRAQNGGGRQMAGNSGMSKVTEYAMRAVREAQG